MQGKQVFGTTDIHCHVWKNLMVGDFRDVHQKLSVYYFNEHSSNITVTFSHPLSMSCYKSNLVLNVTLAAVINYSLKTV